MYKALDRNMNITTGVDGCIGIWRSTDGGSSSTGKEAE
jgi:hypothetical protein